ncbi:MAG: hypothetical protein H0V88_04650 [Pyrinomonadaceae bacterium]|nr:hypothetical protein [Pyrinomonadaceae bacterium]
MPFAARRLIWALGGYAFPRIELTMDDKRFLLRHFLAALAYRTQKALRGAPESFYSFRAAPKARTPYELIQHMESVLGYARTFFIGGEYNQEPLSDFQAEVLRFHKTIEDLAHHLESGTPLQSITPERLLQGPFSDAMTHAGQLAMLRRLAGVPVPPENFIYADIQPDNLSLNQSAPVRPGNRRGEWHEGEQDL